MGCPDSTHEESGQIVISGNRHPHFYFNVSFANFNLY